MIKRTAVAAAALAMGASMVLTGCTGGSGEQSPSSSSAKPVAPVAGNGENSGPNVDRTLIGEGHTADKHLKTVAWVQLQNPLPDAKGTVGLLQYQDGSVAVLAQRDGRVELMKVNTQGEDLVTGQVVEVTGGKLDPKPVRADRDAVRDRVRAVTGDGDALAGAKRSGDGVLTSAVMGDGFDGTVVWVVVPGSDRLLKTVITDGAA